ncbi:MAG: energy-coupling factor transporter ATPase [candidate division Zixibacteria bacterium]|nr:energy-coupling factor transporter ATPase [candidate division Zixibacteria bacterium]
MIKLEKVTYNYSISEGKVISALQGIDLELKEGEYVSMIGPNGSGKTTLARLLNGLLLPSSGEVLVDGLNSKVKEDLRLIRQKVGMVFQNPENQIITTSVEREIAFGLENLNLPSEEIRERVEWALSAFHLWEYKNSPPHSLSGGEKQRLAIASVLAMKPKYLILDEPTSLLDPEGREMFNLLIKKLAAEGKVTIISITQFPEEAILAQRLLVLDKGRIILDDSPEKVFEEDEKLKEIGLAIPKSLEIANGLKRKGFRFKRKVLKIEDLIQELLSLKGVNYSLPVIQKKTNITEQGKSKISEYLQIELENSGFIYNYRNINPKVALKDINLKIKKGEFVGLIGPTGSGKTTLAQLLDGLLFATSGLIRVEGLEIKEKVSYLKKIRQKVGLVFQFPERQLFEETVYEDIAFGPKNLGLEKEKINSRVRKSLEVVGLDFEAFAQRSPFSLSSGEQRRVAIAGILALEPEILILDEPTAGLDFAGICRVKKILLELNEKGVTIILISHNLEVVAEVCKRIIYLKEGKILFDGSKTEFFGQTEKLQEEEIEVPDTLKLLQSLKKAGFKIRDDLYETEGIIEELFSIFGKKEK